MKGTPQFIIFEFSQAISLHQVQIMFQGGFAGHNCQFCIKTESNDFTPVQDFFPTDTNELQTFDFQHHDAITSVKLVFTDSTDFYGRITIYKVDLLVNDK